MSDRHQILCINKSKRMNPYKRILSIGDINNDRSRWKILQQKVADLKRLKGCIKDKFAFVRDIFSC